MKVNDTFSSFVELTNKIEEFQNATFTMFKKRNCVTKAQGEKLKKSKILKEGIEYYSIKYTCKHGGRDGRQSQATGKRESK